MTPEERELLFKDLCSRLPYGVKLQKTYDTSDPIELYSIDLDHRTIKFYKYKGEYLTICDVGDIERFGKLRFKPYLFPLSSVTEEQYEELWKELDKDRRETLDRANAGQKCANTFTNVTDWYNKNHFDYRGLIPMGLAIDATGLNVY